jgi:choice-of-anchor C domain-containing protein
MGQIMLNKSWLAALVCGAAAVCAQAAPFQNGSFEDPAALNPGAFVNLPAGSTAVTGWTVVGSGGVDYIGSYWNASAGARSIDISGGGGAGSGVQQTFDTVAGTSYTVSFDLSGNTDCAPVIKSLEVNATPGGAVQAYSHDTTGTSLPNIPWTTQQYTFTATSAATTLSFTTPSTSACGPALDNVVVAANATAAVPALSEWSVGLLALAIAGFALRSRRKAL